MDVTFAGLYGINPLFSLATPTLGQLVVQRTEGASSDLRRGGRALDRADDALGELQELTEEAQSVADEGADEDLSASEREALAEELASLEAQIGELVEDTRWAFTPLLDGSEDLSLRRGDAEMTVSLGDLSLEDGDALDEAADFAARADDYADYLDDLEDARGEVSAGEDFLATPTATTSLGWAPASTLPTLLAQTVSQIQQLGTLSLLSTHRWSIAS